ncbi:MAG: flagellar biosynthesis protein FlhB [Deltaproteobacteria bacterium]|nr:flagellar biosynthesis protein FlhB [Deltaproteobacteria bacterium]
MAADGESGEKTEQPTGRRVGEARNEGMIPRSVELSQVLAISTAFIALGFLGPRIWQKLIVLTTQGFTSTYGTKPFTMDDVRYQIIGLLAYLLPELLLLLLLTAIVGAGSTLIQTKFNFSMKMITPKFSRMNPVTGLKRLFAIQNVFQTIKSCAKLAIILPIAYSGFMGFVPQLLALMAAPTSALLPFTSFALGEIFWDIMKLMFVLAIFDYAWNFWRTTRNLKMTKTEVKDERKSTDGDDRIRFKFRQIAMQRMRQRMMKAVKTADVVVTNPTHYSVALVYTMERGTAPKVVAKGKGFMALRIREIAKESGVPVVERKPLARALFATVEVGQEIPYDLFAAVAELLAYVYKIKGRHPLRHRKAQASQTGREKR